MNLSTDAGDYVRCRVKNGKRVRFEYPVALDGTAVHCDLNIGAYTYIRGGRIAQLKAIGRFCSIAPGLTAGDGQHPKTYLSTHPFQYRGVNFNFCPEYAEFTSSTKLKQPPPGWIGSDVWIGANVTIMRGVVIGHGAIIAAGAIVTSDVQPYEIVMGVPARHHKFRFEEELIQRLLKVQWWNYTLKSLEGVPFDNVSRAVSELERRKAAGRMEYREPMEFFVENGSVRPA